MSLATLGDLYRTRNPKPSYGAAVPPAKDVTGAGTLFFGAPALYLGEQKSLVGFECSHEHDVWFSRLDVSYRLEDGSRARPCVFCMPMNLKHVNQLLRERRPLVDRGGWELRLIPKRASRVSLVCVTPKYG